jgi:2-polyprenyl-3-methyl-5-hydroxy-6-metoxy-1,4-benzoquinol methylase
MSVPPASQQSAGRDAARRMGDGIEIAGDYQHRAIHEGGAVQRFWHQSKLLLIDRLVRPAAGQSILDVGCGSGVCSGHMGASGAEVTGVDGNAEAIAFARRTYGRDNVHFSTGHVDDLRFAPQSFDKAICFEVIEHLYHPQVADLLREVRRVLKRGGELLITTPNYRSLWPAIEFMLDRLHLVPALAGEQHVSQFTHDRLTRVARSVGFVPVARRSICSIGPWLAPFSTAAARRATLWEIDRQVPAGTILAHLYRVPDTDAPIDGR